MRIHQYVKDKKVYIFITLLASLALLSIFVYRGNLWIGQGQVLGSTAEMESVVLDISPPLDFSRFAPYTMSATLVPDTPSNVSLNLSVDMGDDNACWDFNTIGECTSQPLQFNMTYNPDTLTYTKSIYPDYIYPEIFFATSEITWNNAPLNTPIRRNDYHIFHFTNKFATVSDMNIWVEFNTVPVSTSNSADLQVYIVEKGHDITYFNTDWRTALGTEVIGSVSKNATVNHVHTTNSSHHLIRLGTDTNGKVGNKALDISGDFWVVLYSNSPNTNRGWNLRYQPTSLCDNNGTWYRGDISGWTTTAQAGCPDAHIHISRSNINYLDSVQASVSATYGDGTYTSPTTAFNFTQIPNLPPNPTSFISPIAGSRYSGNINVQWNPATDPNPGDTLYYTIYLTQSDQSTYTILSNSTDTSVLLNSTIYDDDSYTLSGKVCDNLGACTETNFSMGDVFYIDNILTPETLTVIDISSNNQTPSLAKTGDIVSISMTSSGVIAQPTVNIYSNGNAVTNSITVSNTESNTWVASYIVSESDSSGDISFEIYSTSLDRIYYDTTNQSSVTIDVNIPSVPISSLESGTYLNNQNVTLTSSLDAYIKYLLNVESISCTTGFLYQSPIEISSDSILKTVACDSAGNSSSIATYTYTIQRALTSIQISSSNSNPEYAKVGDTVSLTMQSSGSIETPVVNIYSGGVIVTDLVSVIQSEPNIWIATYEVEDTDTQGLVSFEISSSNLDQTYFSSTDQSIVTIDLTSPINPTSSLTSGEYISSQEISLDSSTDAYIRYTINSENVSCTIGYIYDSAILITQDSTLRAIACDSAGNISGISSFIYTIKETLESIQITSSNRNSTYSKVGDTVTLSFTSTGEIPQPTVVLQSNSQSLTGTLSLSSSDDIHWQAIYTILQGDPNGLISFTISSDIFNSIFTETTNLSRVTIDTVLPSTPISNISSGTYTQAQRVVLTTSSSSSIRYTLNGDTPSCLTSPVYMSPLILRTSKVIKVISCDSAFNQSPVLSLSLAIFPDNILIDTIQEEDETISMGPEIGQEEEEVILLTVLKFRILDSKYNPIPNLAVSLHSNSKTEYTDINGIVIFKDVEIGDHTLIYSYKGIDYEESIEIAKEDIKDNSVVNIVDIVTPREAMSNTYLIYIGILVFTLLIYIIIRGILKSKKNIDKEKY